MNLLIAITQTALFVPTRLLGQAEYSYAWPTWLVDYPAVHSLRKLQFFALTWQRVLGKALELGLVWSCWELFSSRFSVSVARNIKDPPLEAWRRERRRSCVN
jgi:hypothetical protein